MKIITPRWSLKWIVIIGSFLAVTLAILLIVALAAGHLKIVRGTEAIKQVTVPGVLEASRIVRNLEHLRRYGDMALSTASSVERNYAQMSMTLIAMHPGMQANEVVQARIQRARIVLGQALALSPLQTPDQASRNEALALWAPIAQDLTLLADEITMESSRRASDDAHRIHMISTRTLSWLTFAIVAVLLCGLIFGGFLLIFIATPLQRNAQVLDQMESNEAPAISMPASPIREIDRLRVATYALAAAMKSAAHHQTELESMLTENRQRTQELENALSEIKQLQGILPICASCKKIRNDQGAWQQIEVYIRDHSEADFSHGICPRCYDEQIEEFRKMKGADSKPASVSL